jgi:hypothetical protein
LEEITEELERTVWPLIEDPEVTRGFTWWLRYIWNVEPDELGKEVGDAVRSELAELYLDDAQILHDAFGVSPPWIAALRAASGGGRQVS